MRSEHRMESELLQQQAAVLNSFSSAAVRRYNGNRPMAGPFGHFSNQITANPFAGLTNPYDFHHPSHPFAPYTIESLLHVNQANLIAALTPAGLNHAGRQQVETHRQRQQQQEKADNLANHHRLGTVQAKKGQLIAIAIVCGDLGGCLNYYHRLLFWGAISVDFISLEETGENRSDLLFLLSSSSCTLSSSSSPATAPSLRSLF